VSLARGTGRDGAQAAKRAAETERIPLNPWWPTTGSRGTHIAPKRALGQALYLQFNLPVLTCALRPISGTSLEIREKAGRRRWGRGREGWDDKMGTVMTPQKCNSNE